jgi:hypothetical protein
MISFISESLLPVTQLDLWHFSSSAYWYIRSWHLACFVLSRVKICVTSVNWHDTCCAFNSQAYQISKIMEFQGIIPSCSIYEGCERVEMYWSSVPACKICLQWVYMAQDFTFPPLHYSPNLHLGLPPWNSPFHFCLLDLRHSVGLLGRVISSSQGLYVHTNTENAHTRTHAH